MPDLVRDAFELMTQGRKRPTALFLPQDLMAQNVDERSLNLNAQSESVVPRGKPADPKQVERAIELFSRSQKPLILAGGGAVWGSAQNEIQELSRRLNAPVATTVNGKGILDERHSHSIGHLRSLAAQAVWPQADLVVA
ncbi:MAG: thiamine pyrophosphate-binding protein, partial [Planctomycetes bacterium]|nr:thiamine pyrophosphate-binding protein [Planctomycetota bacterium]